MDLECQRRDVLVGQHVLFAVHRAVTTRQHRDASLLHRPARARLVAQQLDDVRVGTDEPDVTRLADLGEVRRFRQESVAGMDRVGAGNLGGADDRRHVEVAVGAARRADADVLVGEADVQRVLVGLGVHGHGLDAELAARVDDAQGDLAAVRDQDFLEHPSLSRTTETRRHRETCIDLCVSVPLWFVAVYIVATKA